MHHILLFLHSANRWFLLILLLYGIYLSAKGGFTHRVFDKWDNFIRHFTATLSHIQLMLGLALYMISPVVKFNSGLNNPHLWVNEYPFFKYVHITLMVVSVILLTIGSAKAKRIDADKKKYRTMLLYFSLSLIIIIVAIPWPFSPLANRPFFRPF